MAKKEAKKEAAKKKPAAKSAAKKEAKPKAEKPAKASKPAKPAKAVEVEATAEVAETPKEKPAKKEKAPKAPKLSKAAQAAAKIVTEENKKWHDLQAKHGDQKAVTYSMSGTFEPNQPLQHKVLGWGYIVSVQNDRLEVLFETGTKMLISNYKG